MSDAWAVIIGGVGGAALTGAVSWLIVWRQGVNEAKAARHQEIRAAYSDLLGHSAIVMQSADAMHQAMATRSGLGESFSVTLGIREALDPLKLWEVIRQDHGPLMLTWSRVWTTASQEGIDAANTLVERCAALMASATVRGDARTPVARALAGEKWTQEQLDEWAAATKAVAHARRDLVLLARRELGYEAAEVFATAIETGNQGTSPDD